MSRFIVGAEAAAHALKGRLERELGVLRRMGAPVYINEARFGGATYFAVSSPDVADAPGSTGSERLETLRAAVAQAISDTIVNDVEPETLRHHVIMERPHYELDEVDEVVTRARRELIRLARTGRSERRHIASRVLSHLWDDDRFHVDGFIRFRLRDYAREMQESLGAAIKTFEAEKEYVEFVHLLKYFMECQAPTVEELHILPDGRGSFNLVDKGGTYVDDGQLERFVKDLAVDGYISREDLLVSALVTLAPTQVHCHLRPDTWNLVTLEKVLAERLEYCTGCARCLGHTSD